MRKKHVLEAALFTYVFLYVFIIFIDFLAIKSLCEMRISKKSRCSIINNKCSRTRNKGIKQSCKAKLKNQASVYLFFCYRK